LTVKKKERNCVPISLGCSFVEYIGIVLFQKRFSLLKKEGGRGTDNKGGGRGSENKEGDRKTVNNNRGCKKPKKRTKSLVYNPF
jgi:hypothetical protein